jgi:hypothetical protein
MFQKSDNNFTGFLLSQCNGWLWGGGLGFDSRQDKTSLLPTGWLPSHQVLLIVSAAGARAQLDAIPQIVWKSRYLKRPMDEKVPRLRPVAPIEEISLYE